MLNFKQQIRKIFDIINQTLLHQYLILSRRPQRISKLKIPIPLSPDFIKFFPVDTVSGKNSNPFVLKK